MALHSGANEEEGKKLFISCDFSLTFLLHILFIFISFPSLHSNSFDCVLDETARPGDGDLITFKLFYNVEDDTVTIKELPENQQGRDGFKLLLKRTKLPKNWKKNPIDFASIIFDTSDADVEEFYEMKDFMIGATIFVFGRKFLLLDCDKYTRDFFDKVLRMPQPNRIEIERPPIPDCKIVSFLTIIFLKA